MMTTRQKVAIAKFCSALYTGTRRVAGLGPELIAKRGGVRWQLDLREGIDLAIYLGVYERDTLLLCQKLIGPGSIVLDIGANVGFYALNLAKSVGPEGRIIAFEPTSFAFQKQRVSISLNANLAPRIISEQMLLVASDESALDTHVYSSWPLNYGGELHQGHCGRLMETTGARASTLDSYVTAANLDHIDLIKLDVDGHEMDVLSGAKKTLLRYKPPIVMEFAPHLHAERGHNFDELVRDFSALGYRFYDEKTGALLPSEPDEIRKLIKPGASRNVLLKQH